MSSSQLVHFGRFSAVHPALFYDQVTRSKTKIRPTFGIRSDTRGDDLLGAEHFSQRFGAIFQLFQCLFVSIDSDDIH